MFIHEIKEFKAIVESIAEEKEIFPYLIEKDYWIMHCLWSLKEQGFEFYLKGGTSLSKAFGVIDRFSEDIDIVIIPPNDMDVKTGKNHDKKSHIESRANFFDYLKDNIKIPDVTVIRDTSFDDMKLRNGGLLLEYPYLFSHMDGVKRGVLLEVGFAKVDPFENVEISSWVFDRIAGPSIKKKITDNRAKGVSCYYPEYTFVEKLQAISRKFSQQQKDSSFPVNFLRHYYDIYRLLELERVQEFIKTKEYRQYKDERFAKEISKDLSKNEAFLLSAKDTREIYQDAYDKSLALYYGVKPTFSEIMQRISQNLKQLSE